MLSMIHLPKNKPEQPVPRYSPEQIQRMERHWKAVVESQQKPVKQSK